MSGRRLAALVAALGLAAAVASAGERDPAPAASGTMVSPGPGALSAPDPGARADARTPAEELAAVCRELRASDENYFGEAPAAALTRRLGGSFEDPMLEAGLRFRLGRELLELGRPQAAIELFERNLAAGAVGEPWQLALLLRTLGLAHLQAAEDLNCLEMHAPESCILPIRGSGVHARPEHARQAAAIFSRLLAGAPSDAVAAWLLNLSAMVAGDYPEAVPPQYRAPPERLGSTTAPGGWTDRAPDLGVAVRDLAGGAVMDDFDGDGLLDLVSTTSDPCGGMKAFRNDGRGGFEDVSAAWGLAEQLGGLNLVHADYDGDGRLDLLVLRGAWLVDRGRIRNSLLRNELRGPAGGPGSDAGGAGRFVDVTRRVGLAEPAAPTQTAAWADYDGDGDLDLYVGNETSDRVPVASQLFRNDREDRNGEDEVTFTDVAAAAGVTNHRYAKGVAWGDYDDDGDPDLYVSNVGGNRLYRNDGEGRFTDVAPQLGVTAPEGRSFACWFFDYDNDGDLDLFVADYSAPVAAVAGYYLGRAAEGGQPLVYRNDGGRFAEVSRALGIVAPLLPMGANYGDVDGDGYPDVYLGTGDPEFESLLPNVLLRNDGGRAFEDATAAYRLGHLQKGHGVAFGDVDEDGDLDLFHQLGGFYPGDDYANALFENPGNGNRWITLGLRGRSANRWGVGARIEVRVREGETERSVHVLAGSGGSFGGSSLRQEIGLGSADEILEVIVRWPGSGRVDRHRDVALDAAYLAVEGESALEPH